MLTGIWFHYNKFRLKVEGMDIRHLTLDDVIESEGREVWGFNIEEDVLILENVADGKMNDTSIEFVRVK